MKRVVILLFSFFAFLFANQAIAQAPVAKFGANLRSACTPMLVQFTDSSTGSPTAWYWTLGNGTTSQLQNPSTTYTSSGTYTVTLTVTNANGTHTKTEANYIHAVAAPVADFVASDSIPSCGTKVVTFTNLTNLQSAGTATYYWDFGDGTFSVLANPPAHTYSAPGNYTVSLVVTNGSGCTNSKLKVNYITILAKPVASFTSSNSNSCTAPLTASFNSTSTGAASYFWDFGDGSTGTGATPSHVYMTSGSFNVKLRVVSAGGCMDSVTRTAQVNIGNLAANFTMSSATTCTGNEVGFTNTTTPGSGGSQWSFGDGGTSNAQNPTHVYSAPGTYTIKLKVSYNNCVDSISKTITVNAGPSAQFSAAPTAACAAPLSVNFSNTSSGAVSYLWIFGNGNTSTSATPTETYGSFGNYNVTLVSTAANGCRDTLTRPGYINIVAPSAQLANNPYVGCAPASVNFTPTVNSIVPVVSYNWTFGDGGTGSGQNPAHTYSAPGTYLVTATFTTATGCVFTASQNIIVGSHTTPSFSATPTTVCYGRPVTFTNSTTGNPTRYTWLFGNGGTSNAGNPTYVYNTPGTWTVRLVSENNGCADTATRTSYITVLPPVAQFSVSLDCSARTKFTFNNLSTRGTSFFWDFGDGNTSTATSPVHTFAAYGDYIVRMVALDSNTGCIDTAVRRLRTFPLNTDFVAASTDLCLGSSTTFQSLVDVEKYASYLYGYGDGVYDNIFRHTWQQPGVYTISYYLTDIYGCSDSSKKTNYITVHEPTAGFSHTSVSACRQITVTFTDTSRATAGMAITNRVWDFGDGTSLTTSATTVTHTYTRSGNFSVSLTVTETGGCSKTVTKTNIVTLTRPTAAFTSPNPAACTGTVTRFSNTSTGANPGFIWDFGDGSTSTAVNPTHIYAANGTYTVRLIVVEPGGCRDTLTRNNYIVLSTVDAGFTMSDSLAACPPFTVNFTDTSVGATRYEWLFGNGNSSTVKNPSVGYLASGTYYPRLVASNTSGCFDTAVHKIVVATGPQGTFSYSPTIGCSPVAVNFVATSNTSTLTFDFDNGATLTTSSKTVSYMYTRPGVYHPRLIISNGSACTISIVGLDSVMIQGVHVGFLKNTTVGCQGDTVRFTDTSKVVAGVIARHEWDFGDGDTSMHKNPTHVYRAAGTYNVRLVVTTFDGCQDTTTEVVTMNPLPVMNATNQAICANDTAQLTAGGAASYVWAPAATLTCTSCANPKAFPAATSRYTVTGTSSLGCIKKDTVTVTVTPRPALTTSGPVAICAGSSTTLTASGANSYSWIPTSGLSSGNGGSVTANPAATTVYAVTGSSNGCSTTDTLRVTVNPMPVLSVTPAQTICAGSSVSLQASGATTYNWTPSTGLSCTTCASPTANPTATTTYTVTGTTNGCSTTSTVSVTVLPVLNPAIAGPSAICAGNGVTLTASGATSYSWTPSTGLSCTNCASPTADPAATTTYTVTATASGCSATVTKTITVNPKPTVAAGGNKAICLGASATMTASGATSYTWTPGNATGATLTVSPAATTKYYVTGTDANGCTNTDSVTVTVNPLPVVSAGNNTSICPGGNAVLTASGATGYVWSPSTGLSATTGASVTATPSATTTYTVTGTDGNNCVATANVTVAVNGTPNVTVTGTNAICAGGTTSLSAAGANSFSWTPSTGLSAATGANVTANPTTTTTYTVTGTSGVGCTGTATFTVTVNPKPVVDAGNNVAICAGSSATLTATGATGYAWTPGTGTAASNTVTPTATTKYYVTGTDANGCTNTDSVTVTVNPLPVVSAGNNTSICPGGNAVLTATGATGYVWSPSTGLSATTGASVTATPSATTTYTVTGTDGNNCVATANVTVAVNGTPNVTVTGTNAICAGGTTSLSAAGANSFSWTPSTGLSAATGANVTANPATTTTYTVTGTSGVGCTGTATFTVTVNPKPVVDAGNNVAICAGSSATLTATGATGYAWTPGTGTAASNTVTPTATTKYYVTGTDANGCTNTDSVTVTVNPLPVVSAGNNTSICPGGNAVLTASGATGYVWSPSTGLSATTGASVTATPSATTTYTVTGTDGNNCVATANVTVAVNGTPNVTVTGTNAICAGGTTSLSAAGANSFSWTPSTGLSSATGANVTANPTTTTTYTVTGTSGVGCTGTATFTVTVNPKPVVDASADTAICTGAAATLRATGAATYTWTPGTATGNNISVNPAATTKYYVTGTDANGCTNLDSVTVSVNPLPVVSAGNNTSVCPGGSATLTATGAASYSWSPATGLNTATGATVTSTPAATTTYTVTGTDANGCIATANVTVAVNGTPNVTVTGTNAICAGGSTSLSAAGANSFSWTPSTGLSATTGANVTANPTTTTTYTITGTSGVGCTATATFVVTVNPKPTVDAGNDTAICTGSSATLRATGASGYAWTPGTATGNSVTVNPIATTKYYVTGTDANGCTNLDSVTVRVNPLPVISAGSNTSVCPGGNTILTATGGVTYVWSPSTGLSATTGASVTASPAATTTYTVTGTNADGCSNTGTVTVSVNGTPSVSITGPSSICIGGTAQLTAAGANTFSWSPATGLSCTSCANPVANPTTTTTYTVTGTSGVGCTGTATYTISVNPKPIVDAGNDTAICTGTSAMLRATGAVAYAWTPGTATGAIHNVNPTVTTRYFVTGTDANGCSNTDSVTVNVNSLPTIVAGGATSICPGGTATLTATGGSSYLWTPTSSLSSGSGSSVTASPGTTTTYTVVGTSSNQCSNSATVTVTVNSTPSVSIAGNNAICAGGNTSLTASGANSYTWTPATGLSATTGATVTATPTTTTTYTVTGTSGLGCTGTTTFTVTVNAKPIVDAGADRSICSGSAASIVATGATTYSWTPSTGLNTATGATVTATPASTTTYIVTGTGPGGCTANDTVVVTVKALPTVSAGAAQAICPGQSVSLTATGADTYAWTPSTTLSAATGATVTATPSATTTYTVTGTAADGCIATSTVVVSVNAKPTVTIAGRTSICSGDSATLTASGATNYSWTPAGTLSANTGAAVTAKPTATTQYKVIGTSGAGCLDSAMHTITVNPLPVVTVTRDTTLCAKISLQLNASGAASYQWLPTAGLSCTSCSNPVATPSATTTYTVVGIDQNGCSNKADVRMTILAPPVVNAGQDKSACRLNSVNLNATGAVSYVWTPAAGLSCTTCDNPVATPNATTSYIVTGTGSNGCLNSDTVVVNIYAQPAVNAGPDQTICAGTSAQLQASGAATYIWTPASNLNCTTCANPVATPERTASYQVSGTDIHGCRDSDIVTISVIEHLPVSIDSGGQFCIGGEKRLWASGGDSYTWAPAASLSCTNCQDPIARPTETTTYSVLIRQGQCFADTMSTTLVVHQLPTIDAGPNRDIILGNSVTLQTTGSSDIKSYVWTPYEGLSCNNCAAPVASPARNTLYQVTVVSEHGCENSDTVRVNVRCDNAQIFMPNTFSPNADGHNDFFYPHGKGITEVPRLRIYNRWGEVVFDRSNIQVNDRNQGWDGTFRNQPLKPDVYVWIMNATCTNGEPLELKGDITLVR